MPVHHFPIADLDAFSQRDRAYAAHDERLMRHIPYAPTLGAFEQAIAQRQRHPVDRSLLTEVLREQYADTDDTEAMRLIESLSSETTFTVTTAHQPVLFGGPMYVLYKAVSAIKLSRQLAEAYPDYEFVPVFVTGGEDHDFEEIQHVRPYQKTVTWEREPGGSVGRMPTDSLTDALAALSDILGDSDEAHAFYHKIAAAYTEHDTYGPASAALLRSLLGQYGLLVLRMDEPRFKQAFIDSIRLELTEQPSVSLVSATQQALEQDGFSAQATPRDINLFYLGDGYRARIVQEGDHYEVLDQGIRFTRDELLEHLEAHPERFSPNVVMRPLYQETILPNLAYVGGGGELAYWMERRTQFERFGLPFPVLVRRDSALVIDRGNAKRMTKLDLLLDDLFGDIEAVIKAHVHEQSDEELQLTDQKERLRALYDEVLERALRIDPGLKKSVQAEAQKQLNAFDSLEKRLVRAEKRKHETTVSQIRNLYDRLFPGGGLQERYDSFLPYLMRDGDAFVQRLLAAFDPLAMQMHIFTPD